MNLKFNGSSPNILYMVFALLYYDLIGGQASFIAADQSGWQRRGGAQKIR